MRFPVRFTSRLFALQLILLLTAGLIQASELPSPKGPILLTITGEIRHTNRPDQAVFDRGMLESLEQRTTQTHTPWAEGSHAYSGPLGRALLEAVGGEDARLMRITALNDFVAEMPVSDFLDYEVILATHKNDRVLRVRDRGPLFVIYPFDEYPQLNTEMHYNRSVWQVRSIELVR
ncbi:hypothetical protein [Marinospirillum alkaliphilum]|uniref:Oxidoreductase molybdopterin-binding domain-containing protein n=1 Tax=Marinospirillum alkaliphilum DSM 21637 TaxID=1122209 RepID=A0A1K1V2N7_9GAMM|nr:hypothetical protein [Marinospirillum alkaliphilum]SFX19359.1 hypothetical protein SAMN02745752_00747 [Marinospirillum alkaliphilum DSM 21637]